MNAKRVNAAMGVIHASQKTKQTAAGIAADLEAACLLQSPESAAELATLRSRFAALPHETRTALAEALGDAKPARDGLLTSLAQSVKDCADHDHPQRDDLYCANLAGFMGERMGPVLRRLLNAELERDALRDRVAELEAERAEDRPVDEDPIAYALTEQAEDVAPQVRKLRGILARQREDAYQSPLHHDYALGHDLPETTP